MELIPIGEAARLLGVNASALRYYEQRGIVRPAARTGGKRRYGRAELRRLAFIQMAQRLGFSLDVISEVLDEPGDRWRRAVGERITAIDEMIDQARRTREILVHVLECPAEHPVQDCPVLAETLDLALGGPTPDRSWQTTGATGCDQDDCAETTS